MGLELKPTIIPLIQQQKTTVVATTIQEPDPLFKQKMMLEIGEQQNVAVKDTIKPKILLLPTSAVDRISPATKNEEVVIGAVTTEGIERLDLSLLSPSPTPTPMGELDHLQHQHFATSIRSGRRNALPDLGLENADPGAHKLAEQFESLFAPNTSSTNVNNNQSAKAAPTE